MRERGDGHYQSIFTSPLRPEQIARPRRDGDEKFRSREIASWRQVGTGVTTGSSSVRQSFTRGREWAMGGEGEGGRRGPFLDGCRQVFLPSDDASSAAARERRERDSSQLIFSSQSSPSPLQAGTVTSQAWATSDLEGSRLIVFLRNWERGGLERERDVESVGGGG